MKFLACSNLENVSSILHNCDLGDRIIDAKVEAYSCKLAGEDKRLFKQLDKQILSEINPSNVSSPLGNLDDPQTRKLLISLISTLNASFADYDFSDLRAVNFKKEPQLDIVAANINSLLLNEVELRMGGFRASFWKCLHEEVETPHCEVYSYVPVDDDELGMGKLWCLNYFFFNKRLKKLVFLNASATSKRSGCGGVAAEHPQHAARRAHLAHDGDDDDDDDDDDVDVDVDVEMDEEPDDADAEAEHHVPPLLSGYVDVGLLDWEQLGMVEQDLGESKWMAQRSVRKASGGVVSSLQAVVSPVIRPTSSPLVMPSPAFLPPEHQL